MLHQPSRDEFLILDKEVLESEARKEHQVRQCTSFCKNTKHPSNEKAVKRILRYLIRTARKYSANKEATQ